MAVKTRYKPLGKDIPKYAPFQLEIDTRLVTAANTIFEIPFFEDPVDRLYEFSIDWGDNTTTTVGKTDTLGPITHTYTTAGIYTITFVTQRFLPSFTFYNATNNYQHAIKKVKGTIPQLRFDIGLMNLNGRLFGKCVNLTEVSEELLYDNKRATLLTGLFEDCTSLASVPSKLLRYASKVTNCEVMFKNCTALTSIPEDIFKWATKLETVVGCFFGTSLSSIPANLFTHNLLLKNIAELFAYCSATTIPESLFANNIALETATGAFFNSNIASIPNGLIANKTNLRDIRGMFAECTNLGAIPGSTFLQGLGNVENCNHLFADSTVSGAIPSGFFDSLVNCMSFSAIFRNCTGITAIPSGLFDYCTSLTEAEAAFQKTKITSIPNNLFSNTKLENSMGCFAECDILTGVVTQGNKLFPTTLINAYETFYKCSALVRVPSFDGCSKLTSANSTFMLCTSLTTTPTNMFRGCSSVTTFMGVFAQCSALTTIGTGMFSGCSSVITYDYAFMLTKPGAIPSGLFTDSTKAKTFIGTFYDMNSNPTIPSDLFAYCPDVTSFYFTFAMNSQITRTFAIATMFPATLNASVIDIEYMFGDCQGSRGNATTFYNKFNPKVTNANNGSIQNCSKWTGYASVPAGWRTY